MNEDEKTRSDRALPQEVAAAVNLLAHPMAGFAAVSALGFGVASQIAGLWMGSVAGAIEAANRVGSLAAGAVPEPSRAAVRAKTATDALIADVKSRARQVAADAAGRQAAASAKPAPSAAARKGRTAAAPKAAERDASAQGLAEGIVSLRQAPAGKPAAPDDLKAISGIGPKLEQVLNGMGVWTYAQIASWTPEQAAAVDDRLGFAGRIGRDDWVGQAKRLAGDTAK